MNKFFILTLLAFIILFFVKIPVFAHILHSDGSIGVLLHIDPDDDPIAGQQTTFFLTFKDKDNKFQSTHCYCRVDVLQHEKIIYSDALFQQSINKNIDTAFDSVTFPIRDVYQIKVVGTPRTQNEFQPFTITYDIRVDRTADQTSKAPQTNTNWFSTHGIYLFMGILIIFAGIFAIMKRKSNMKNQNENKGGEKNEKNHNNTY